MKSLYLDLVQLLLVLTVGLNVFRKPLVEELVRVEKVRHHKVK